MSIELGSTPAVAPVGYASAAATESVQRRAAPEPVRRPSPAPATAAQLDAFLREHKQSVRFQVDQSTGMTIVNIYNEASGELVQQIPNEVVVRIAQYLKSQAGNTSVALDTTA